MKKNILSMVLAGLCLKFTVLAQDKPGNITALKIGDTVPDITINDIVNYKDKNGKPATAAKISDFKGKLLILDFWDTWCSSCIKFLSKSAAMNRQLSTAAIILPVTAQKTANVERFLNNNQFLKKSFIQTVTDDKILSTLFPHNQLPHEVWISAEGKILAVTTDEYVNVSNITAILAGGQPDWVVKSDQISFDKNKSLFSFQPSSRPDTKSLLFTSVLTGYTDGVAPVQLIHRDTIHHTVRYTFINQPVLNLYALILNSGLPFDPNRSLMSVNNTNDYRYDTNSGYYDLWLHDHSFTYEAIVPVDCPQKEVLADLQLKLQAVLKVCGEIKTVLRDCWVLRRGSGNSPLTSKYAHKAIETDNSASLKLHRIKSVDLADLLEHEAKLPVLNEALVTTPFDLDLASKPLTIGEWNEALQPLGFFLEYQKRPVTVFALSPQE